jgi:hypothetical protein
MMQVAWGACSTKWSVQKACPDGSPLAAHWLMPQIPTSHQFTYRVVESNR